MIVRLILVLLLLSGVASGVNAASSTDVVADDRQPGTTIPADFAGFSLEPCGSLTSCPRWHPAGADYLRPSNSPLLTALRRVSPVCRLRIGGNSSDIVPPPAITPDAARGLAAFLQAANGSLIFGLDAKADDAAAAVEEARVIADAVGLDRVIFQIGNEPSLHTEFPPRQRNFERDLSDYAPFWLRLHQAVETALPGARFMGPDDVRDGNLAHFAASVGATQLTDLTVHSYPMTPESASLAAMMATTWDNLANRRARETMRAAGLGDGQASTGPGMRLTEFNSVFGAGGDGVADSLASAIWVIEYGMQYAAAGFRSIHLHGRLADADPGHAELGIFYSPLSQSAPGSGIVAHPIYYGMMVLGRLVGGRLLSVEVSPTDRADVAAYATQDGARTRIVVVNRATSTTARVRAMRRSAWTHGTAMLLTGAGCDARTGVTLGGASLAPDGGWAGHADEVPADGIVSVPPCSALLVMLD